MGGGDVKWGTHYYKKVMLSLSTKSICKLYFKAVFGSRYWLANTNLVDVEGSV